MGKKIAVLEDDFDIRELISIHLKKSGYKPFLFDEIGLFYQFLAENTPDLLILDLMLPDGDGLEVCKTIRRSSSNSALPIIILTAKSEEFDKVLGLELGADDYISKPFSPRELIARIKSVLRRAEKVDQISDSISNSGIVLNSQKHEVLVKQEKIDLTSTEFKILKLLMGRKGWVFSRNQILDFLWGKDKIVIDRTVDVHIKHLRTKLGSAGSLIKNIRGIGYKFDDS